MRPKYLKVKGFLGIKKLEYEFKPGVFVIEGPNGSGKSSFLESIVFALFGSGVRFGKRVTGEYINRDHKEAWVVFSFEKAGKSYEVSRSLEKSSKGAIRQSASLLVIQDDRKYRITGVKEVNEELMKILGMTYDTFNTTFFLPQGEATKFLTSTRSEIAKLVMDVFLGKNFLDRIKEKLKDKMQRLKESDPTQRMEQILALMRGKRRKDLIDEKKRLERKKKEIDGKLEIANSRVEKLMGDLRRYESYMKKKEKLEEIERKIKELETRVEEERVVKKCKGLLGDFLALKKLEEEYTRDMENIERISGEIDALEREKKSLISTMSDKEREKQALISEDERIQDELEKLRTIVSSAKPILEEIFRYQHELHTLNDELKELEERIVIKENHLKEHQNASKELLEKIRYLDEKVNFFKEDVMQWMAYEISSNLKDGDTCPVCGNVYHPKKRREAFVDFETYDRLRKELEVTREKKMRNDMEIEKIEEELHRLKDDLSRKRNRVKVLSESINAMKERLKDIGYFEGVDEKLENTLIDREKISRKLRDLEATIGRLSGRISEMSKSIQERKDKLSELKKRVESFEERLKEIKSDFLKKLEMNGLDMETFLNYKDRELTNAESSIESLRGERRILLEDIKDLEMEEDVMRDPREELEKAEKLLNELRKDRDDVIVEISRISRDLEELSKLEEEYRRLEEEKRKVQEKFTIYESMLKSLRSEEFQTFFVNRCLEKILDRANNHLSILTNGRFSLKFKDGFVILDRGQEREARGLSGGERTLVSITLAMAVAETVAGEMETFFIDEGFSSLDSGNKKKIAESLKELEKLNKVICFITHDKEFSEEFDKRIILREGMLVEWT